MKSGPQPPTHPLQWLLPQCEENILLVSDIGESTLASYASVMALLANYATLQLLLEATADKCLQENSLHRDEVRVAAG